MPLSPEAAEIVRQATVEALTRRLTPDDVFAEVVRLSREAQTPAEIEAIGRTIGEITALGKMFLAAAGLASNGPIDTPQTVPVVGAEESSERAD